MTVAPIAGKTAVITGSNSGTGSGLTDAAPVPLPGAFVAGSVLMTGLGSFRLLRRRRHTTA